MVKGDEEVGVPESGGREVVLVDDEARLQASRVGEGGEGKDACTRVDFCGQEKNCSSSVVPEKNNVKGR